MKKLLLLLVSTILLGCPKSEKIEPSESISITFISPIPNQELSNNKETVLSVKLSEEVKKVEYFLDGVSVGSVISDPRSLKWTPKDVSGGDHVVAAVATSNKNNDFKAETKINMKLNLGDDFQGGKIFQLTGYNSGLIASTKDLQIGSNITFTWGTSNALLGTTSSDGQGNTKKMASASSFESQAAYHFKNGYDYNGFKDWYIPSFDEINILKDNVNYVGGFEKQSKDATYWTSSELSASHAHIQNMIALIGTQQQKALYGYRIRPIRKF